LPDIGINLYNPGIHMSVKDLRSVSGNRMTILGNVPPRDVLAAGTPEQVAASVKAQLADMGSTENVMMSCGGGMPPSVSTENIKAFIEACKV
jgi:uroporphyrinogen-III decarboxylase